jgi:hypothetical protein
MRKNCPSSRLKFQAFSEFSWEEKLSIYLMDLWNFWKVSKNNFHDRQCLLSEWEYSGINIFLGILISTFKRQDHKNINSDAVCHRAIVADFITILTYAMTKYIIMA